MTDKRSILQQQAVNAWFGSGCNGTIVAGTGAGKSKITIDILKRDNPDSILLLTNSSQLRDINWKDECIKFGFDWNRIQSETYQKMYKLTGYWELIIYDEVDFAVTEEYKKCLINLKCAKALALTGFLPTDKEEILKNYIPVCFRAATSDLQEDGVLNQSEVIIIQYPLDKTKNIQIPLKKGGFFMNSENDLYKYYDGLFQKSMIIKSGLDKKMRLGMPVDEKQYKAADWNFKMAAVKRKSILSKLASSVTLVKNLVAEIHSRPNNKIIIFSAITEQSDKFGYPTYHGKANSTETGVERLNSGEITTLCVCKAISRGTNMIGVNYLIRESFDSSETDFNQSHGRLMRLENDQIAKYIILVPMYEEYGKDQNGVMRKNIYPTQAMKWANNMLEQYNTENVRTIKLDSDLKLKDGIKL